MKTFLLRLSFVANRCVGLAVLYQVKCFDWIIRACGGTEISHSLYASFRTNQEIVDVGNLGPTLFFAPSKLLKWRANTWLTKEPETIDWIDSFEVCEGTVFWDIGANIGLYSIYAAKKHPSLKVFSFEPSTSNLPVLSKNVSLNRLSDSIAICPFALTSNSFGFQKMNESSFEEGGALNSFGVSYGFDGKDILPVVDYTTVGFSVDYLVESQIVALPTYIKIDVDGIEHLIIKGATKALSSTILKGVCIELNEDFKEQYDYVHDTLQSLGFKFSERLRSTMFDDTAYCNVYNYFYVRGENSL